MPAMKLLIVAAINPSVLLSFKSHLAASSVTSTIEQAAHCGEHQPLWEQRVRGRDSKDREEENRRCGRRFADMDH